jgi:hypothetical protein
MRTPPLQSNVETPQIWQLGASLPNFPAWNREAHATGAEPFIPTVHTAKQSITNLALLTRMLKLVDIRTQ